jgi:hypothetical protein
MRLSPRALMIAGAIVWGGYGIFLTGLANIVAPPYGEHFLLTMSSVYPGYHANRSFVDLLVGTAYGAADGGIGGFLIAWIYNRFARG